MEAGFEQTDYGAKFFGLGQRHQSSLSTHCKSKTEVRGAVLNPLWCAGPKSGAATVCGQQHPDVLYGASNSSCLPPQYLVTGLSTVHHADWHPWPTLLTNFVLVSLKSTNPQWITHRFVQFLFEKEDSQS